MSGATPDADANAGLDVDDATRPPWFDRLRGDRTVRIGMAVAGIVAVVFAIRTIASRWSDASALELHLSPGPMVGAAAAVIAANTVLGASWAWLVARLGHRLPTSRAFQIWWTGQLGTYLPTGLGSVPARVVLACRHGVPRSVAVLTSTLEPLAIVSVCAADAALLLNGPAGVLLAVSGLVGIVVVLTAVLEIRRRRPGQGGRASATTAIGYVAAHQVQVAIRAAGFFVGLTIVDPISRPSFLHLLGVIGASYLVGFLVVFAPGGLGAREATMTALLSGSAGPTAAAAAAVAWRLLEVIIVLPSVAVTNVAARVRRA